MQFNVPECVYTSTCYNIIGRCFIKSKFTSEEKATIVHRYESGESVTALAHTHGISRGTIYNWIHVAHEDKPSVEKSTNIHLMSRKLQRMSEILEIKNRVQCTSSAPLQERLCALEPLYGQYNVHVLCESLNVDRGTFYNHIKRNKKGNNNYTKRKAEMTRLVQEVYEDSHQIYGAAKIAAVLQVKGISISPEYVRRIMNELGITSIRVGAKGRHQILHETKKSDHVQKNFTVKAPNEVWVSDSTSFKVGERWFYICVIIDLFSRKVIAYKISQKHTTNLMTATFRLTYESRKPAQFIFHSDRGTQYTANGFMKLLKSHGVTQSFSPTGSPYHNAVMESFFSNMKKGELYRHEYRSAKHFSECIDAYIHFYNEVRPHYYLKYKTPSAYEQAFFNHLNK